MCYTEGVAKKLQLGAGMDSGLRSAEFRRAMGCESKAGGGRPEKMKGAAGKRREVRGVLRGRIRS